MITERRYDIDWLRVIAIGLLLIYHIAIVFQPWAMFIGFIRSEESMLSLWTPMSLLNVWRIPLLFFVSGMGTYFAMRKRNIKELLFERAKRILLPFVFGLMVIVPLHFFIFQQYYGQPLSYFAHPAHLWFLGNLVIYLSLLFPLFHYLMKNTNGKVHTFLARVICHPVGLLSTCSFFVAEVLIVNPQVFSLYAQTAHGYAIGFLAFIFGFIFMYVGQPFWTMIRKWSWVYLGLGLGLYVARLIIFEGSAPNYLIAIESNVWIFGIFGVGYRYLNKPSSTLRYLSSAAYPVYIIHMIGLYLGASIFLPIDIPVVLKFVSIVLFTGVFCMGIFELVIKRIPVLRIPFGLSYQMLNSNPQTQPINHITQAK